MLDQNDLKLIKNIIDSSLETGLAPIKEDIDILKQDVSGLKQDVSGLKQDVSALKNDMAFVKHEISQIRTEMNNFRSDLARIEAKIDRISRMETEDVTVVSGEVQILKQKYIELEQQVKILQQQRAAN